MKRNGIKALGVPLLGALALFLASCGQQPPPSNGGGNGGGSQPTTGTLEVTVLDNATGNPIQGASVVAQRNATPYNLGTTNAQGKVSATLEPGTYNVTASANGYQQGSATATVTAGQTATLTLRLQAQVQPPAGPGVCVPGGDTSYRTELVAVGDDPKGVKSIQITGPRAGTYCFVAGVLELRIYLPQSEANNFQVILQSTDNPQANQVIPHTWQGSYFVARIDTRNQQLQGVIQRLIVKRQAGGNDIRDQVWTVVPDNLPPQLPDVRPVSAIDPVEAGGPQPERWIGGPASYRVTLTLENQDLVDQPDPTTLLASGIREVRFYAFRVGGYRAEPRVGEGKLIGVARARPYQVEWNTRDGNWPDGKYYVYAVAEDWMGNAHPHPTGGVRLAGFFVNVDNTAPGVSISVVDRGTGDVGRAFNPGAGLDKYRCDNPNYTYGDGRIDIFLADPDYVSGCARVTYTASDTGVGLGQGDVELSWAAVSVDVPEAPSPFTLDLNVNDVNGPVTFVIKAKDRLGNESQASKPVTVDNRRPELSINSLYLPQQPSMVDPDVVLAGSQLGVRVAATDTLSGVKFVRMYMASDATAAQPEVRLPFWNANVDPGSTLSSNGRGLIQLPVQVANNRYVGEISGGEGDVLVPVLDPTNEKRPDRPDYRDVSRPDPTDSRADLIAIAVDRAGNAKPTFRRIHVRHTDELTNGIDGSRARLYRNNPVAGEHEIKPEPISDANFSGAYRTLERSTEQVDKYAAFYRSGSTPLPYDDPNEPYDLPSYLSTYPSYTLYGLVQLVNTLPFKLVDPDTTGLFGVLFNNYGHMEDVPFQP